MPAPTGPANLIKAQIKATLDALVTDGVIGAVIEQPINANILSMEFNGYPCAILGNSNMIGEWEYPQSNRRTYEYIILVVQLQDNITGPADMEDIRDAMALKFDNAVTLSGTAPFGVAAVSSPVVVESDQEKTWILFNITIRATTLIPLTYAF